MKVTTLSTLLVLSTIALHGCAASDDIDPDADDGEELESDPDPALDAELAALVADNPARGRCATPEDASEMVPEPAAAAADNARTLVTINVVFHVIRAEIDGRLRGNLSRGRIDDQLVMLNNGFLGTRFRFELQAVTRTTNREWFRMTRGSAAERAAKRALHRGGTRTLNLYSTGTRDALGWSSFPRDAGTDHDGVVIQFGTTPNDSGGAYSLGETAIHEVGHWLGLFHTFGNTGNGCTSGDAVSDTPAELSPAFGCPTGRDTCAGGGDDPIHNYMDYVDDACMFQFSAGQRTRMSNKWDRWRD